MNIYDVEIYLKRHKDPFMFKVEMDEEDYKELIINMRNSKKNGLSGVFWFNDIWGESVNFDIRQVSCFTFKKGSR